MKQLNLLNPDLWRCEGAELVPDGETLTIRSPGEFRTQIWQSVTVDLDKTPAVAVTVDKVCEVEAVEFLFRIADLPRRTRSSTNATRATSRRHKSRA